GARVGSTADDLPGRDPRDVRRPGEEEGCRGGNVALVVMQRDGQLGAEPEAGPRIGCQRVDGGALPGEEVRHQTPAKTTGLARSAPPAETTPPGSCSKGGRLSASA